MSMFSDVQNWQLKAAATVLSEMQYYVELENECNSGHICTGVYCNDNDTCISIRLCRALILKEMGDRQNRTGGNA